MFGYITIDREELKGKDLDRYREFYCGVCWDLKDSCGEAARATLTYDMTFLAILLNALYEGPSEITEERCILHPARKRRVIRNEYTAYAADMNLMLVFHNLEDDWIDEKKGTSLAAYRLLRPAYLKTSRKYPRQTKAILRYVKELHAVEEKNDRLLDTAAGLTGKLMAEIFRYRQDIWSDDLGELGFYVGKFIYLMDAWDDLEKDRRNSSYNPFLSICGEPDYEMRAGDVLTMQAAGIAKYFEKLPILLDEDLLRNILYSGIWVKYRAKRARMAESQRALQKAKDNL